MAFCSCFGRRKSNDPAEQPLLSDYQHDTVREQRLHEKLHTYQIFRALSKGFLPSNEQIILNLRTLLASDLARPDEAAVSDAGRLLGKNIRQLLGYLIALLQHKNASDQIQDFVWCLSKAKLSVDTSDLSARASKAKSKAQTAAAYESVKTIGSLAFNNPDFRLFVSDLQVLAKGVVRDSASAATKAVEDASHHPKEGTKGQENSIVKPNDNQSPPSKQDLQNDAQQATSTVHEGIEHVAEEARESAQQHFSVTERQVLFQRLQSAVGQLRQQPKYEDSVSTLTLLVRRYIVAYTKTVSDTVGAVEEDVHTNDELDTAVRNLFSCVQGFGDANEWDLLRKQLDRIQRHEESSPELEKLSQDIPDMIQGMLTDPTFYENPEQELMKVKSDVQGSESGGSLREDVHGLTTQARRVIASVLKDGDVLQLKTGLHNLYNILSPPGHIINEDLINDCLHHFAPQLLSTIQFLPIPRLEVSTPEIDLLLENLILEPGHTINQSSFLPFRFRVEAYNDIEVRKARTNRIVTSRTSLFTLKLDGISLRAEDIGFWFRMHKGIFRFADEGLASFRVDDRGIDIHIDVEVGKDNLEKILSLRGVRVHIHNMSYKVSQSKFAWLSKLFKPLLKPIIRKTIERQLATAIADFFHAANRELLYARERLRATRIANPQDLATFVRAIAARLQPPEDPDLYTRIGFRQPGQGVFKGVYTPGSLVKVWEEEGERAGERVDDFDRGGWRNEIFDVKVVAPAADGIGTGLMD